ncbi:MAG: CvpA family protein [Deltaproteobacteria bacterium]|nr:CvpA family protein [Deltaproteobacteria bacterium]MBW2360203.1 CvpA family protein [Deltaproteobacteria bacterium]
MEGTELAPVDYVVAGILLIAVLRGMGRGLLRETFSMGSLAAAVIAVRLYYIDVAQWLLEITGGAIGEMGAPWAAGLILAVGAIGATTLVGRVIRRGAKSVGLGWADRAGGALLGTAEGLLVAGVIMGLLGYFAGRSHPVIAQSRSLVYFEELERMAREGDLPDIDLPLPQVAAPPPPRREH